MKYILYIVIYTGKMPDSKTSSDTTAKNARLQQRSNIAGLYEIQYLCNKFMKLLGI